MSSEYIVETFGPPILNLKNSDLCDLSVGFSDLRVAVRLVWVGGGRSATDGNRPGADLKLVNPSASVKAMRKLFLTATLFLSSFAIAVPIPDEVIGIWATANSEFRGDAVFKGDAIYLDADGVGGWIGGDGTDVLGVRIVVTSFDPTTHILVFKMTEYGRDGPAGTLVYDPTTHSLTSEPDGKTFERRKTGPLSVQLRRSLGLEQKQVP